MRHYQCVEEEIRVEALIEEQRRVSVSQNPFERVIGSLCLAALLKQRLAALPDEAVGQLMVDHVCNDLNVFSPETTICEVATERLRESAIAMSDKHKDERFTERLVRCRDRVLTAWAYAALLRPDLSPAGKGEARKEDFEDG